MVYVYPRKNGNWIIYAHNKHHGTFRSRKGAEMYRDRLIEEGIIHPLKLDENRYIHTTEHGNYVIRKSIDGRMESFGTYKDIHTARLERDYMEKHKWRYDDDAM